MKKKTLVGLVSLLIVSVLMALCFAACGRKVENVHLNFVVDGQTISTIETSGKEVVAIPNNPEKEGYTFDGWYWDKDSWVNAFTANSLLNAPISSDMSVYAKMTPIQYSITYNLDGGLNTNPSTYTIETSTITLSDATKEGYTFNGWYKESSFSNKVETLAQGSIGNVELFAKFTINQYTISFDTDGGNAVDSLTQDYNTTVTAPIDPVKEGYNFGGWYLDGVETAYNFSTMPAKNISLKAKWTPTEYFITYNLNGGENGENPEKYTIETSTITLANPTKAGYSFNGWYKDENKIENIEKGSTGNISLTAQWTPIEYTITYENTKSVNHNNPVKFTIESNTITLLNLEKLGYTFNGWYNGLNKVTEIPTGTIGNITLTADWTVNGYEIRYHNVDKATINNPYVYDVEDEPLTLADASRNGYVFKGWYSDSDFNEKIEVIPVGATGDKDIYAKWEIIEYTITYVYDNTQGDLATGDALKTVYTVEDEFDFVTLVCSVTGYEFSGWYTEKVLGTGTKYSGISAGTTGNKTYYAQWSPAVYTITYHNVESVTNTNPTTYTIETESFSIENVSKVGYTFDGWYSDSAFENLANTYIVKGSHGNIEYYAKWNAISYSITYNLFGGTYEANENPTSYTIEDSINLINPIQNGKYFVGWYKLAENGELITTINGMTGNITLYARWLSFDSKGGSTISYELTFSETGITKPNDPTKDYYDFAGWFFDEQFSNEYTFDSLPKASSTLYAKWNATNYNITYILNGGTNNSANPSTYTVEDAIIFEQPNKTGYTFNGWYSDKLFTSALVTGVIVGSHGDITIYANFGINQYTISFESNGGTSVDDITQNYATNVTAPANPAKTGYSFGGWYSDNALKNPYTFTTVPAYDFTLYAKWDLVDYSITYNLDGGTNSNGNPGKYTITDATIVLSDPTKTGYTFVGWYADSLHQEAKTEIASGSYGDIELFAKWEIITYTITYDIPSKAINDNPTEYTIATPSVSLVDPLLAGYVFDGWFLDETYMQPVSVLGGGTIGDITFYGKFTANLYNVWLDGNEQASCTVSFDLNGASGTAPAMQKITETNTLTYPSIPTRNGYLFCGWYIDSECGGEPYDFSAMVASDITLYAKWEAIGNSNVININGTETVKLIGTNESVYKFIPLVSGNVSITTIGEIDTLGTLYQGNICLKQDDDSGDNGNFLIVYNVTAGEVYDIHVRGFSSSVNGSTTLSLKGVAEIAEGGYSKAGNNSEVTYDAPFALPVPEREGNYKFLGWQDVNGVMYTDSQGISIIDWDKAADSILYSKWEKMIYTVTFDSTLGSAIDPITLEYGARLDLSRYVPTRANYSFGGWYLSPSDTEAYSAGTMPDHNLTLHAKWTMFALGTIKYDEDKKAISVNDTVTADLFNAICLDTNGDLAEFSAIINGVQTAGETVSIRLIATSGNKTKQVTVEGVKVYGTPTITVTDRKDYINLKDGLNGSWFGASGRDTFGQATDIVVRIDGEYAAGDTVTVYIDSVDPAGSVISQSVENVKLYGLPIISYNTEKTAISVHDTLNAALFGATAIDSFGEELEINVKVKSGYIGAGKTVTIEMSCIDSKGNAASVEFDASCYGTPKLLKPQVSDISVDDELTPELFNIVASDSFNNTPSISLQILEGELIAGTEIYVRATATDVAGNSISVNFAAKVFGKPEIICGLSGIASDIVFVSFDLQGGLGNIGTQVLDSANRNIVFPEIPTKEGYAFSGWYEDSDCTRLFDFNTQIDSNLTIYAGWTEMVASNYYSRKWIDISKDYNSASNAYSQSNTNTSSSSCIYTYFTALASGKYTIYYKNNSSSLQNSTYFYMYNVTQKKVILSNTYVYSKTYKAVETTANAGDIIYIRNYRYNSSSDFSFYIDSEEKVEVSEPINRLNINAFDSFGNRLHYVISITSGEIKDGETITCSISATDHLGNSATLETEVLNVYAQSGINLIYSAMASDIAKIDSAGEEFSASATDSYGNPCVIYLEAASGFELVGGNVIDLYIVAQDVAGNIARSELIRNIKIYDQPQIVLNNKYSNFIINESDDISFIYSVYDSFGEELYANITVDGNMVGGNEVELSVSATDDAGNEVQLIQRFTVLSTTLKCIVEFYVGDTQWQSLCLSGNKGDTLPVPDTLSNGYVFYGWRDESDYYTSNDGVLTQALFTNTVNKLYAVYYNPEYTIIKTLSELKKISMDGKYVLVNNISLGTWTPLGTQAAPFTGILDGNGFALTSMKITTSQKYMGLFGYSSGTIKNLTLRSVSVNLTYNYESYTGALIGYMSGGAIINCSVSGSLKVVTESHDSQNNCYIGGLVGYAKGNISNCSSEATIISGGKNSSNGTSRGYGIAGGLVAILTEGNISNSFVEANVSLTGGYMGYIGGLIGQCNSSTITACYFEGTASSGFINSSSALGGLIATSDHSTIEQSYTLGVVKGSGTFMACGGLIGSINYGNVNNCYSLARVEGGSDVGGLIGENDYARLFYCFAGGDVTGRASYSCRAGGLVGLSCYGSASNCFATGDVVAETTYGGSDTVVSTAAGKLFGETGVYGDSSKTSTVNCYGSGNYSAIDNHDSSYPKYCYDGIYENVSTLKSKVFLRYTLVYNEEIWNITDGEYPKLCWQN